MEDFLGVPVCKKRSMMRRCVPNLAFSVRQSRNRPFEARPCVYDIYGDGSAVLVDLSGHTAGPLGCFALTVKLTFSSAAGMVSKAIDNRPRPSFVDWVAKVDSNFDKNSAVIAKIHQLTKQWPELIVIPAHDETLMTTTRIHNPSVHQQCTGLTRSTLLCCRRKKAVSAVPPHAVI